jgi:Mrp family chromosome partitioning ATPase
MKLFKRKSVEIKEEFPSLVVPKENNLPALSYSGVMVDSLRQLISRLGKKKGLPKRLALVAALRQEGVSYLSQGLAATIANDLGLRVCLVELNYWWPDLKFKESDPNCSLAGILEGKKPIQKAVLTTGWPNFNILPAGEIPRHVRPKISNSDEIKHVVTELGQMYDHLILDIPAILATTDSVALASLSSSACLVIHQGITHVEDVHQALEEVEHLKIDGVILNLSRYAVPMKLLRALA